MKKHLHRFAGGLLLCLLVWAVGGGCLRGDSFDHKLPEGQGSIIVDNRTSDDLDVFVDGQSVERVRAGRWRAYNQQPGTYRVVLDSRRDDRNYRDDVDVLEGRLTVMEVTSDSRNRRRYSVYVYFD